MNFTANHKHTLPSSAPLYLDIYFSFILSFYTFYFVLLSLISALYFFCFFQSCACGCYLLGEYLDINYNTR